MKLQLPTRASPFPSSTAQQHTEPAQHGPVTPRAPSHAGALLGLSPGDTSLPSANTPQPGQIPPVAQVSCSAHAKQKHRPLHFVHKLQQANKYPRP